MGQKLLKLSCNKKWEWSAQEVGGYGAEVRELALGHSKVRGEQVIRKEWALLKDLPSPEAGQGVSGQLSSELPRGQVR